MSKKLPDEEGFVPPQAEDAALLPVQPMTPASASSVEPAGRGGRYMRDPKTGERVLVERTAY